ncbi:MAG: hypothetical protein HZB43_02930 [candidate division Zixibacteria bacterium]|nr:hypothetical protein [candidate division Zixibacteria bacterium]
MPRQNTRLEAEGAEFLVLGNLLAEGIPAFKSYTNIPGYDLIAVNPDRNLSARIQVKSRWRTKPDGFIIKGFECDFVVLVLLNRGSKDGSAKVLPPDYYVLPVDLIRALPRTEDWGKISSTNFPVLQRYRERWDLIGAFLKVSRSFSKRSGRTRNK